MAVNNTNPFGGIILFTIFKSVQPAPAGWNGVDGRLLSMIGFALLMAGC
jgi:hypothetical protein